MNGRSGLYTPYVVICTFRGTLDEDCLDIHVKNFEVSIASLGR